MARAILELIADPASLLKGLHKSSEAAEKFGKDLKGLQVTAEKTANAEIQAAVRRDARLRGEIATYRQVASAAKAGSREQVAAANLATRSEERLARSLAVTSREAKEHARSIARSEREIGRFSRGAIAGSGVARSLGRSLAFASGGFLATASITAFLRASIDQGSKAAATQRQLVAQFKASKLSLRDYRAEIDATTHRVSALAGIEDDDLVRAFTAAFRGTKDVTAALKEEQVAADVSRATGRDLASVTLGLTKAYLGQTAAARRLGIFIPKNVKGMQALEFVGRRFAGQAAAGTTQQEKFEAALNNTEETIGLGLLPSFNKLLEPATKWLQNEENQRKIQHSIQAGLHGIGAGAHVAAAGFAAANQTLGPFVSLMRQLSKIKLPVFGGIPFRKGFANALAGVPGAGALKLLIDAEKNLKRSGGSRGDFGPGASRDSGRGGGGDFGLPPLKLGATTAASGPLGFKARFATVELALAQAQLTKAQADDRKILKLEAALLRERIKTLGTSRKTLADRTALTVQLVSIEGQITSIDQDAASKVTDARKKRLSAEQKAAREAHRLAVLALRNQAQRLAAEKSTATKELSALKQRETALSSKIKQIQSSFRSALDTARQGIGGLFGGPVLNFSDEQRKAALGIPNSAADPKTLVADLRAQVQAEAARQRNINRIQKRLGLKRGSPLISELRANTGDATQVGALAGADTATLRAFAKQAQGKERLALSIARADMRVQLVQLHAAKIQLREVRAGQQVFHVYINGVEDKQAKVKVKQSAAQRRGPVPGRG